MNTSNDNIIADYKWSIQNQAISTDGATFCIWEGSSPSITRDANGNIFMAWSGSGGDGIYYATFSNGKWSGQNQPVDNNNNLPFNIQEGSSPSVAYDTYGNVFMAWNASGGDGIHFATFVKGNWYNQGIAVGNDRIIFGIQDRSSPCVISNSNGDIFMAWNGSGGDGIYYSVHDYDSGWSSQNKAVSKNNPAFGIQAETSPSLACDTSGNIFMAWNGFGRDGIYYSVYANTFLEWSSQNKAVGENNIIFGIQAGSSPSLAVNSNGSIFMAWNGSGGDGIYYSVLSHDQWLAQQKAIDTDSIVFNILSNSSPNSITNENGNVFMVWSGTKGNGIFYSEESSSYLLSVNDAKQKFSAIKSDYEQINIQSLGKPVEDMFSHIQGMSIYNSAVILTHNVALPLIKPWVAGWNMQGLLSGPIFEYKINYENNGIRYKHPCGFQIASGLTMIPVEINDKGLPSSFIQMYSLRSINEGGELEKIDGLFIDRTANGSNNIVGGATCVGFARNCISPQFFTIVVHTANYPSGTNETFDVYQLHIDNDTNINTINYLFSQKSVPYDYQNISIINQSDGTQFLIGLRSTDSEDGGYDDFIDLYQIDFTNHTIHMVTDVVSKKMNSRSSGVATIAPHFRWGAGAIINSSGNIVVFSSCRNLDPTGSLTGGFEIYVYGNL